MNIARSVAPAVVAACSLALTGCASGPFALEIRHAGKLDPARDEKVADEAQAFPWAPSSDEVLVTTDTPRGLVYERGALVATTDELVVLGSARSFMEDTRQVAFARAMFFYEPMHPSHSGARNAFCIAQFPLRTLTLGIWGLVSPTSWPCWVTYTKKLSTNAAIHQGELVRAAKAMGGNLVVLERLDAEDQTYVTGYGWNAGTGHESGARRVGEGVDRARQDAHRARSGAAARVFAMMAMDRQRGPGRSS